MEQTTKNNAKTDNKITLADRFAISMFSAKEYPKILQEKTGKIIGFLFILVLLLSLIRYGVPALGSIAGMGGIKQMILREVPDFSISNGEFTLDDRYEKKDEMNGIYLVADTDVESFSKDDVPKGMVEAIMISKTNIIVYNEFTTLTGNVDETKFSDFGPVTLNNEILAKHTELIYISLAWIFVMLYAFEFVKYLLGGLIYTAFILLYAVVMAKQVKFGKAYKAALYAHTVGSLVYAITLCIGNSVFIFAGSIFEIFVTFIILRKVLMPIKKPTIYL